MEREHGQEEGQGQGQGKAARLTRGQMAIALRIGSDAAMDRDGPARHDPDGAYEPPPAGVGRAGAGITVAMLVAGTLAIQTVTGIPAVRTNSGDGPPSAGAGRGSIPRAGGGTGAIQDNESRQEQQKMFGKFTGVAAATAVGVSTTIAGAQATAVQWRVEDGGNGHWYALDEARRPWTAASAHARAVGGHLATVTTHAEHLFLRASVFTYCCSMSDTWLGARRDDVEEQYRWVTGEPFAPLPEVPFSGNTVGWDAPALYLEQIIRFSYVGEWNGESNSANEGNFSALEWSADCNADGIVDYGQVADGTFADGNSNNVPDCCELGIPCLTELPAVQWRVEDGGNGHWYQGAFAADFTSRAQCAAIAEARGGTLVSIGSAAESAWLYGAVSSRAELWTLSTPFALGPWIGARKISGQWTWDDGTPWGHTDWLTNERNGSGNFVQFYNSTLNPGGSVTIRNAWNDNDDDHDVTKSLVIEWSADCDGDGIVDFGQIRDGSLPDRNLNGIPDACEPKCAWSDIVPDGSIDGNDLSELIAHWGPATPMTRADIDRSGDVDGGDIAQLLAFWGTCTP
jgi:hypothetical protein